MDWSQLWSSPLEFFAVVTGVLCVFLITVSVYKPVSLRGRHLFTIDHVLNWPIGVLTSAAYVYIFWKYQLYLNSGLQVFYVITGFIGWYWWLRGGADQTRLPIQRVTPKFVAITLTAIAVATVVMWQIEANVAHSAAPFFDALVVTLSLAAQFVMTRKFLEHWWLWIAVDVVGVGLFASQGLLLTSLLYLIYGCICVRGLVTWNRMYSIEQAAIVPNHPLVPALMQENVDDAWNDWDGSQNSSGVWTQS